MTAIRRNVTASAQWPIFWRLREIARIRWHLLPMALARVCNAVFYAVLWLVAVAVLVGHAQTLRSRSHVLDNGGASARACVAFGEANSLDLRWSIRDGCHKAAQFWQRWL